MGKNDESTVVLHEGGVGEYNTYHVRYCFMRGEYNTYHVRYCFMRGEYGSIIRTMYGTAS